MRTKLFALMLALPLMAVFATASAQSDSSPIGRWKTFDDKTGQAMTITEVYEARNGKLAARVVETLNMPDAVCTKCTGEQKNKPIAGMPILWNLEKTEEGRASVRMGALCGRASEDDLARLDRYATALGLAFQIRDDILDVEGDSATLGKTAGKDAAQDKATFPSLIGLDASRARLGELAEAMQDELSCYDERADALRALGRMAVERGH